VLLKLLILIGSSIFLVLGSLHLIYTFFTNKFDPNDIETRKAMNATNPRITKETTLWKAWVGFNASHSIGAMFFGSATIYLALFQFSILVESTFYVLLCTFNSLFYLYLARKYWFSVPIIGISLATFCFVASTLLILFG